MDLTTMAQRSWDGAETQGLHDNLNKVDSLGAREQALLALIPLVLKLNDVVQHIKRHGVSLQGWDTTLFHMERSMGHLVETTFDRLLDLCGDAVPPTPIPPGDKTDATAIRLLLVGTEVAEALDTLDPTLHLHPEARRQGLAHEVSDILIRVGDVAHDVGIDLNTSVEEVLTANTKRAYKYGTPLEARTHEDH